MQVNQYKYMYVHIVLGDVPINTFINFFIKVCVCSCVQLHRSRLDVCYDRCILMLPHSVSALIGYHKYINMKYVWTQVHMYVQVYQYVSKVTWDVGKVTWMNVWHFWGQLIRFDSSQPYIMISVVIIVIVLLLSLYVHLYAPTIVLCYIICCCNSIVALPSYVTLLLIQFVLKLNILFKSFLTTKSCQP